MAPIPGAGRAKRGSAARSCEGASLPLADAAAAMPGCICKSCADCGQVVSPAKHPAPLFGFLPSSAICVPASQTLSCCMSRGGCRFLLMVELWSGARWFCEGLYCWFCLLQWDRDSEHTQCSQTNLQDQKVLRKVQR